MESIQISKAIALKNHENEQYIMMTFYTRPVDISLF